MAALKDECNIKERLRERPITDEIPQQKNIKLLQEDRDLIKALRIKYAIALLNDTELVRAALSVFFSSNEDEGFEAICRLTRVVPGSKQEQKLNSD